MNEVTESTAWREGRHVTDHAIRYLEHLLDEGDHRSAHYSPTDEALDRIIQVAALPEHPLNGRWLHAKLFGLTMPERDLRWSTYLHRSWAGRGSESPSVIERLLDWAWPGDPDDADPFAGCDDEVVELAATTLVWCFTTSNRFVRDKATKALACLLGRRLHLIPGLLEAFRGVDDLYVSERLYCACFGAVVRDGRADAVRPVAQATYNHVFSGGSPPAHLLLRDYAREIIEYAASLGCTFDFDIAEIRPPYRSEPPPDGIPTWDDLHNTYNAQGYGDLVLSLWPDHGDFARYVMHSDSRGLHTWVSTPDPYAEVRLLEQERVELPQPLVAEWWSVTHSRMFRDLDLSAYREGTESDEAEDPADETRGGPLPETTDSEEADPDEEAARFLESLSPEEKLLIERHEAAEARHREALDRVEESVRQLHGDGDLPCCWVMTRVMELGWTPERFAEFDRGVSRNITREARKPERIGKKYQWIAYHELAARVTDHHPYQHSYYSESFRYEGPWQRSFRDIDPTFLVKVAPTDQADSCWWLPVTDPFPASAELGDQEWLLHRPTVPDFTSLITVRRSGDSTRWFTLHNHFEWRDESQQADGSRHSRRLSFSLGSFLVRRCDLSRILADVSEGNWTGMEVSCPDFDEQFLGEFAWAPSFEELRSDASAGLTDSVDNATIQRVTFTANGPRAARPVMRYIFSRGFDCSLTESISGFTPSLWLTGRMGLSWGRTRFRFVDASGRIVAFDPSHEEPGPEAFLVEHDAMHQFLEANELSLLWLLIGEKMLTGGQDDAPDNRSTPRISVFRQVYELTAGLEKPVYRTLGLLGSPGSTY